MTQTPHDQFAKQVLEGLLEPFGRVNLNRPIVSEPRAADVWFVPNSDRTLNSSREGMEVLGMLGQMIQTACLLEPFRNAIQREQILACVGELADLRAELYRKAKREHTSLSTTQLPSLWILTPTASKGLLKEFSPGDSSLWTPGFYFSTKTFATQLVVVHHLPAIPSTLWLRLMGRGIVQTSAIAELIALPWNHPFRLHALERLAVLRINLERRDNLNRDEQELAMNLSPAYLEWREATFQEGRQEGRQETLRVEIRSLLEAKFGELDGALEQLITPLAQLSSLERSRLILQSSREALQRWLEARSD
jgi:hypothetical protein